MEELGLDMTTPAKAAIIRKRQEQIMKKYQSDGKTLKCLSFVLLICVVLSFPYRFFFFVSLFLVASNFNMV